MTARSIDRRPDIDEAERRRIHWLALFVLLAVLALTGWYFGLFVSDPVIVGGVV